MSINENPNILRGFFKDAIAEPKQSGLELIEELKELQNEGKFTAGTKLDEGGMKDIFVKEDKMTARPIAMAIPRQEKRDIESLSAFIREARITAQVAHPSVLPIHEIGVGEDDIPFYTMKYIRGDNFGVILKKLKDGDPQARKDYPLSRLLAIFNRICEAISFAHSKGIVHLDLKPENVLINPYGVVQVCDWGLAQYIDAMDESIEGVLKGTPGYLSPEQINGEQPNVQSDVFALGVILYQILTYELPFAGPTVDIMLKNTLLGQARSIRQANISFRHPSALRAICRKAMANEKRNRYESVQLMVEDLEAFQVYRPTLAESPSFFGKSLLLLKRHKTISILSMISITLIFCISAVFTVKVKKEEMQRIEISKKAVTHYNDLANEAFKEFDFEEAKKNALQSLTYKDNFAANVLMAHYYLVHGDLAEARKYALECQDDTNRYLQICDALLLKTELKGDDLILKMLEVVLKYHHPGIAIDICYRRNGMRQDIQSHLPFIHRLLEVLAPELDDYELSLKENEIIFKADGHFTRLALFANLPIQELVLNNSYVRDLSALRNLKEINRLELNNTMVSELEPLRGMNIEYLDISNTMVHDLKVLEDIHLENLRMKGLKVLALSVLTTKEELKSLTLDEAKFTTPHDKRHIATLKKKGVLINE
ncbi:serine/threonine-protein kinase [Lentisphaera profundi]|uniref:Serine/threonine-protein kinase n=1 Tax=Lentisphaera profundi TaxID=1658616 RepID=A0ABY7VXE6_9BACT|nr:serine/threonine-protein kinase [Lentisphaera profundi]WDE97404.1 serine/threonine-protein kinase [Lentisphaera profundi]